MEDIILDIQNLKVEFQLRRGNLTAVDNVSFQIRQGESLGIVGETGCGKSVTALSILRLLPSPPAKISGIVEFEGENLLQKPEKQLVQIRGRKIGMIFQEPLTSLNPAFSIGDQVAECFRVHLGRSKRLAYDDTAAILAAVRVPSPRTLMSRYPHELSGGMRQRVMIAIALACKPKLLIADEPTTALDVTIQAQILELLSDLRNEMGLAMIFISHNLGVVARVCERIAVMYAGSLVELSDGNSAFAEPLHPYTIGLLNAVPRPELRDGFLRAIPGSVCDLIAPPKGCKFNPRCFKAREICAKERPLLEMKSTGHQAACFFPGEL